MSLLVPKLDNFNEKMDYFEKVDGIGKPGKVPGLKIPRRGYVLHKGGVDKGS
jgi:hypothetical protein